MKKIATTLLIACSTLVIMPSAQAAYRKHATHITSSTTRQASSLTGTHTSSRSAISTLAHGLVHKPGNDKNEGWEGIVALVCGILGISMLLPAIPAVIFGAIGLKRKHNHGLALAGLIMGIVGCALLLLYIMIFMVMFGMFV